MQKTLFKTRSKIEVESIRTSCDFNSALDSIKNRINSKKGAIFSSGFDYPGRHSRWAFGFVDPALEFTSKGNTFSLNALNAQGEALLCVVETSLKTHPHVASLTQSSKSVLHGTIAQVEEFFTEEQRSRLPSVFSVLRALVEIFYSDDPSAAHFGLYGAFGYDLVLQFEHLKQKHSRKNPTNDCHLLLPLKLVVVDRIKEEAFEIEYSVTTPSGKTSQLPCGGAEFLTESPKDPKDQKYPLKNYPQVFSDHKNGEFAKKVQKVTEGTKRGDYFEVVLSQTFSTRCEFSPVELFETLSKVNPSPYLFLLNFGTEQLIGSSPEIYVRITGSRYETCPIAGTVARGKTAIEDAAQVRRLLGSEKEEAELTMCTDVDRNDMARVCVPGSVKLLGRRQLEFYSHLIHTVDHIEGEIAPQFDSLDAFQTHMWACTVTGAPKPAALQEIENLENSPRGWYSGAVGMLGFNGNINTGITLRTAHIQNGVASIRAGATLLFGSNPEEEELETQTKAAAFLSTIFKRRTDASAHAKLSSGDVPEGLNKLFLEKLPRKVLLVDYRDSFVHNLASYFRAFGAEVSTVRPEFAEQSIQHLTPELVVLSPGPGCPSEFHMNTLIEVLATKRIPTFGVCLGHQGIGEFFGAKLLQRPIPKHGRPIEVEHKSSKLFQDITSPFEAGLYHSLYLEEATLPHELVASAYSMQDKLSPSMERVIMAIEHRTLPIAGVQFHPESLMTMKHTAGHLLLRNVLKNLR